jgi:hypothetical protein
MQIYKPPIIKELMNSKGQGIANPKDRTKSICPEPQVSDFAQVFKAWAIL